jgi:hypothetical protein
VLSKLNCSSLVSISWSCALQPTGENGATRAPIILDMERDKSSSSRGLAVVLEGRTQNVSASE